MKTNNSLTKKVAVIGGGYTGLVATYRLVKEGFQVVLYERCGLLGGLASTFQLKDGTNLERAYHFVYKTDSETIELCKELGLEIKLHFYISSICAHYKNRKYRLVTPLDLITFNPISFIDRIRTSLVCLYLNGVCKWKKLTTVTAIDWLRKYNGKKATKILWEPLLKGKFDSFYDKITMAWLWRRIKVRQDTKDKGDLTEKLGYFDGGFATVTNALATEILKRGAKININSEVDEISFQTNTNKVKVSAYKLQQEFDAVVCTTPSNIFSKLIKNNSQATKDYIQKLASIDYLAAVLIVFTSKQKLTDKYWHQIHDENAPFLVMLSLTALTGSDKFDGKNIYYIGDYTTHDNPLYASMNDEEIKDKWFEGVKQLFPDFQRSQIGEAYVFKYDNAQHIVDIGYAENKLPNYKTPVPHVFLANFSQIFPEDRGINYAVRDGKNIAQKVVEDFADSE